MAPFELAEDMTLHIKRVPPDVHVVHERDVSYVYHGAPAFFRWINWPLYIPDGVDPSSRGSPRGFTIPSIDFVLRSSSRILSCFPRLHFAARPRLWRVLLLRQHFLLAGTTFSLRYQLAFFMRFVSNCACNYFFPAFSQDLCLRTSSRALSFLSNPFLGFEGTEREHFGIPSVPSLPKPTSFCTEESKSERY